MLTLTEAAKVHLTGILDARDCPDGVAVRFSCQDSGVSVTLDNEKPGDSKLDHEGRTILLLDQNAVDCLDGETVDVEHTDTGGKLYLSKKDSDPA